MSEEFPWRGETVLVWQGRRFRCSGGYKKGGSMKEESLFTSKPTENSLSGYISKLFLLGFNIHGVLQPQGQAAEAGAWLALLPSPNGAQMKKNWSLILGIFACWLTLPGWPRVSAATCYQVMSCLCYFKTYTVDKTLKVSVNKDVM